MMAFQKKPLANDAPFNMAMMFYFRLNDLLREKDRAAIGNDIRHYFQCLIAVYNNVFFQIKKEKDALKIIDKGFKEAENMLTGPLPSDKRLAAQYENQRLWFARKTLMEVDKQLMVVMDEKKMIFPRIETSFGLEKLQETYGLK